MQLHFLDKPNLNNWQHIKPNLSSNNKESIGIKEEAKKIREEGIPEPYQGVFSSEAEFEEHRKFLESYIWKFIMMLFEGSFRLISAHPMSEPKKKNQLSRNESRLSGQDS
mmetsp:Transcript_14188/g.2275  ORF Transcript_14188/g.2275 Transcript_14188/m.2275 type:complete len:110 (+) Transcript_14188:2400-2729(+)|eukprot:CAMPEP_0168314480 /NCGR_PEP_ID=MMETSP0210-20121227/8472_1 /TAXON_ID=40633 /ORGANISM="Condylostoma magnum, Strain COL2" /LENGTH=109 /DNA_ID=CAMNT_0008283057 /DNA_START=2320 /DNA_END=2649 /DNA_ORIENTATION=+